MNKSRLIKLKNIHYIENNKVKTQFLKTARIKHKTNEQNKELEEKQYY